MRCTYCYVPFDHVKPNPDLPFRILDRLKELRTTTLTVSGANPFLFEKLAELLSQARKTMEFIHLDTNLLRKNDERVLAIAELVDLLGVPLDGSTAKIHNGVRSTRGHHEVVSRLLPKLVGAGVPVKINTVVTKENCLDLGSLAVFISALGPKMWSIYEFWPIQRGDTSRDRHQLTHDDFFNHATAALQACTNVTVEVNSVSERAPFYFFVSDLGSVYTTTSSSPNEYVFVGSVFLDATIERWSQIASGSLRENAKGRYLQCRASEQ